MILDKRNEIWDGIALHHPCRHHQTGIQVHLIGIHHNSLVSGTRVVDTIEKINPGLVCMELDQDRISLLGNPTPLMNGDITMVDSSSQIARHLHPQKIEMLRKRGLGPDQVATDDAYFGLEMKLALETAKKHGYPIKLIDILPEKLLYLCSRKDDSEWSALITDTINTFKLNHFPPNTTPSWVANSLFWILEKILFKFNMDYVTKKDLFDFHQLRQHLQLQDILKPSEYYYNLHLRNAIMVYRLRELVKEYAQGVRSPNGDSSKIAVVIGKSHFYGMTALWDAHVANYKFMIGQTKQGQLFQSDLDGNWSPVTTIPSNKMVDHPPLSSSSANLDKKTSKFTYID